MLLLLLLLQKEEQQQHGRLPICLKFLRTTADGTEPPAASC